MNKKEAKDKLHNYCNTCQNVKEGCCLMTQENTSSGNQGFCPAHYEIVKECTTTSAEIKSLIESHKQVYDAVSALRVEVRDRVPGRTVLLITVLSSGFVGLLCILVTHLLAS
jgi:hypothetical protein